MNDILSETRNIDAVREDEIDRLRARVAELEKYVGFDATCPCCGRDDECVSDCTFDADDPDGHERMIAAREVLK